MISFHVSNPDFATAIAEMTRLGATFEPDMHNHAVYDQLYQKIYLGMYKRLGPLYRQMRDFEGL